MSWQKGSFIDLLSLMLHQVVAEKIRQDANSVLRMAQNNLTRWLNNASFAGNERFALLEWQAILEQSTPEEIIKIISQDTDKGQRLRSSSPFVGVLSEAEREAVWSRCAEIRPV